jgi:hypothetical protein
MTTLKKLLVLAGLALVAFSAAASSATAASGISIAPAEIFGTRPLGEITFSGGGVSISCRLSMLGQFTRVLVAIEAQIGHLEGFFLNCLSGGGFIEEFLNLPWPITVNKINDLAPSSVPAERATSTILSMRGAAIKFLRLGRFFNCLYGAPEVVFTVRAPVTRTGAPKEYRWGLLTIREASRPTEARYALARGEALCPAEVTVRGMFEGPSGEAQVFTLL